MTGLVSNDSRMIDSCAPPHRTDRHGRPGGGVADFYLRDFFLTCKRRADVKIHGLEAVGLELLVTI